MWLLLGWSPEDNREIFSLEELVKVFDYHNISKSPAVFDVVKLKWMNGEYLKAMDMEKFYEMAEPYIKQSDHQGSGSEEDRGHGEDQNRDFPGYCRAY